MDDIAETDLTEGEPAEDVAGIEDPDEIDRDIESLDTEVQDLIDAILEESGETLRLAARYDRDDYEVVYARDDVTDGFSEPELTSRIETFVMQGLGEPEQEQSLYDFGALDATLRWYDEAVVAHIPVGEWTGLVFTFDRKTKSLVELAGKFF
jgi:hypothetical protein